MRTRFYVEAHLPKGSADAAYHIVEATTGTVVAVVDPNDALDDPRAVAEKMVELLSIDPETVL